MGLGLLCSLGPQPSLRACCINVSRVCTTCKRGLAPLVPSMLAIVGIDLPPQPSRTHRFHRCRSSGRLNWSSGARQGCGPFYHRHNLVNEKTSSRLSKASVDFKSEPPQADETREKHHFQVLRALFTVAASLDLLLRQSLNSYSRRPKAVGKNPW